jgi:hypothetical protein
MSASELQCIGNVSVNLAVSAVGPVSKGISFTHFKFWDNIGAQFGGQLGKPWGLSHDYMPRSHGALTLLLGRYLPSLFLASVVCGILCVPSFHSAVFSLPTPTFAPRMASIFKPAATTTLFPVDLLVITPGTLPDGTPCPPDAVMEYRVVDLRSSRSPAVSEWQRARRDLWPGHTEWCFKLPPGSLTVQVRCVFGKDQSPPSPPFQFLVKGEVLHFLGTVLVCSC